MPRPRLIDVGQSPKLSHRTVRQLAHAAQLGIRSVAACCNLEVPTHPHSQIVQTGIVAVGSGIGAVIKISGKRNRWRQPDAQLECRMEQQIAAQAEVIARGRMDAACIVSWSKADAEKYHVVGPQHAIRIQIRRPGQ